MPQAADRPRRLIDVSPPLSPSTPAWPGDAPLVISWIQTLARGHASNLSTITLSPHLGAHADAPLHLFDHRPDVSELDLEAFIGPATVIELSGIREITARRLAAASLGGSLGGVERLLLKTSAPRAAADSRSGSRSDSLSDFGPGPRGSPSGFRSDFAYLSADAADLLADAGLLLVGIDTPSVDAAHHAELPVHRRLLAAGVALLEGLELGGAAPGRYELIALPLRLAGLEASPVRALLRPLA